MYKFDSMVPEQYKDSPNFETLSQIFLDRYINQTSTLKEVDILTRLDTAEGRNLDHLGDIIGYGRPLMTDIGTGTDLFAFETGVGLGYTSVVAPLLGGIWNTVNREDGASRISDFSYRYLLKLKVIRNQSKGTPDEILYAVISLSGTLPTMIEGDASFELLIPGLDAGNIDLRGLYDFFLPRPLGVKMTLTDDTTVDPTTFVGRYVGTGALQPVVVSGVDFDEGNHHFWIKAIDDTGSHEQIMTVFGYGNSFAGDKNETVRECGLVRANGNTFEIEPDDKLNRSGVTYEFIVFDLPRSDAIITNHGVLTQYAISDYSGLHNIIYEGSGQSGHITPWSNNKFTLFVAIKDMDEDGEWTLMTPQYADRTLNIASPESPQTDPTAPRVEVGGLILDETFNTLGNRYSIWLMTYSSTNNQVIKVQGNGVAGRQIAVGIDMSVVVYKRVDTDGDWIVVTSGYTPGENTYFNYDAPISNPDKLRIDGQTLVLSASPDINEVGGSYLALILK